MPKRSHGGTGTRLYRAWQNMKARCYRKSSREYENYGGRGIEVCDEWKKHFEPFRDWSLQNGYSDLLTLDRINVNGNYEPNNCRWITNKEQQSNRRDNVLIEFNGDIKTLSQWSEYLGIGFKTLQDRINRWGVEKALTTPLCEDRVRNLSGMKFGFLTVKSFAYIKNGACWVCECDCGKTVIVRGSSLIGGKTKSCGCLQKSTIKIRREKSAKSLSEKARKIIVIQYDSNKNEIAKYNGFIEASRKTNICKCTINRSANSNFRLKAGGYYWSKGVDSLSN